VAFDCNGGTEIEPQKVNHGEKVPKPEDPVKIDCIFEGWYKDECLTDVWNFGVDLIIDDTILYARWVELLEIRWNFEDEVKRGAVKNSKNISEYTPDKGDGEISVVGACFGSLAGPRYYFADGSGEEVGYAANSYSWCGGAKEKYWQVKLSTEGYESIILSSKQKGDMLGPCDFKVQYSTDGYEWTDIEGGTIKVADGFTKEGSLDEVLLPQECDNRKELYLRWIKTSNNTIDENVYAIELGGTNRIDDIVITGKPLSTS
jgi:hypothetical protein